MKDLILTDMMTDVLSEINYLPPTPKQIPTLSYTYTHTHTLTHTNTHRHRHTLTHTHTDTHTHMYPNTGIPISCHSMIRSIRSTFSDTGYDDASELSFYIPTSKLACCKN